MEHGFPAAHAAVDLLYADKGALQLGVRHIFRLKTIAVVHAERADEHLVKTLRGVKIGGDCRITYDP